MNRKQIHITCLSLAIIILGCWNCLGAGLKNSLERDFRPLEATVSEFSGNNISLDTGSESGISKGDLFAVFEKGEAFYLPETKKILGYQRKKIAVCKIIKVSETNSLCRIVSASATPEPGNLAVRFGQMNAAFFIEGRPASPELPEGSLNDILPWFKWLEPSAGPSPVPTAESISALGIDILFQVEGNKLNVYGPGMELLKSYELPASFVYVEGTRQTHEPQNIKEAEVKLKGVELFDFKSARLVGTLNDLALEVKICDLDGDGNLEIIYLLKDRICIAPYRRPGRVVTLRFEDFASVCSFSLLGKRGWLCVNAALDDAGLSSKLLKYENGTLKLIQDQINLWLDFIDTDCDGTKDMFLGQVYERARFRGRKIYILTPTDSGIEYEEQADLPGDFNVNDAGSAEIEGRGCCLFYVSFDGFFKVYNHGHHIWSSLKPVVRHTRYCGPAKADITDISQRGPWKNGVIFNGTIALPKSRVLDSLILFSYKNDSPALYQAEANLLGKICGISVIGKDIVMAVNEKTGKEQKEATALYLFPGN